MSGTITHWMIRLRKGDTSAADGLWNYFSPNLLRQFAPQCRQLRTSDEEDIVSIAFFELTAAVMENKAEHITNRKEFWRLLKIITKRKLRDSLRYENAIKRGGEYRTVSMERRPAIAQSLTKHAPPDTTHLDDDSLIAKVLGVADKMHRPEFCRIIDCKLKGMTNAAVARELGISLRTTQYLIQDIKKLWSDTFRDA